MSAHVSHVTIEENELSITIPTQLYALVHQFPSKRPCKVTAPNQLTFFAGEVMVQMDTMGSKGDVVKIVVLHDADQQGRRDMFTTKNYGLVAPFLQMVLKSN